MIYSDPPGDFDPRRCPVGSLARIAAVLKLDRALVREKARDVLGRYPAEDETLRDDEVPRVVSGCRPYIPREESWEPPDEEEGEAIAPLLDDRWVRAWQAEHEEE